MGLIGSTCRLRSLLCQTQPRNERSDWMRHQHPRLRLIYPLICLLLLLSGCSVGSAGQNGGPPPAPTSAPPLSEDGGSPPAPTAAPLPTEAPPSAPPTVQAEAPTAQADTFVV